MKRVNNIAADLLSKASAEISRLTAENERLKSAKGCQCICHEFPDHGKLQDVLEANRFHSEKVADLERENERLCKEINKHHYRVSSNQCMPMCVACAILAALMEPVEESDG